MGWRERLRRSVQGPEDRPEPLREVVRQVARGAGAVPPPEAGLDDLVVHLRDRLVALADGKLAAEDIDPNAHMFDFGYIDSLTAVTFISELEQSYGVRIEDVEILDQCSTLDAIAERIRKAA